MEGARQSPLEKALATVRGGARMVEAATEDAVAAFDLLNMTGARGQPDDPFDARDPDYIRATVPAMGAVCKTYFRGEVSGLEHIPEEGPVLLVGNHSGGTMIADSFVFSGEFYAHFGPYRRFHQLAHDVAARLPATGLSRWGTVAASHDNARRAFRKGAPVLVYPGGDYE